MNVSVSHNVNCDQAGDDPRDQEDALQPRSLLFSLSLSRHRQNVFPFPGMFVKLSLGPFSPHPQSTTHEAFSECEI